MVDEASIKAAVVSILKAIGEDPNRSGLVDTPARIAEMYTELFMGVDKDAKEDLKVSFGEGHREMIIVKDIPFYSMCEHHLLPFYGMVHIGYIPDASGRIVGISKLARVAETFARRLQIQERMTTQIADTIMEGLKPTGVAVVVNAEHLCMIMRGIKKPGTSITTSAIRGVFLSHPEIRAEFLSLIRST